MSKNIKIATACALSVLTCTMASAAHAGPFTSKQKIGDLMMVMSPAYAWGMTVMEKDYTGTLQLGELMITTQLAVEGIKMMEIEQRPNGTDWRSFPSGHAAGAFSGAMFVHKRYGWKPAIIPYGMSLISGWSRVHTQAHYWHDIAAGAAISALFTWGLVDRYENTCIDVAVDADGARLGFKTEF